MKIKIEAQPKEIADLLVELVDPLKKLRVQYVKAPGPEAVTPLNCRCKIEDPKIENVPYEDGDPGSFIIGP